MTATQDHPAPNFHLMTDKGDVVDLKDFKGSPLVIYFYPKDDTPGCTKESCDFRDKHSHFYRLDCNIIGVSPDNYHSHEHFAKKYALNFPLLADTQGKMCRAYGVWRDDSPYIERATFLLDSQGIIKHIWRDVTVEGHVKEVLEALKHL